MLQFIADMAVVPEPMKGSNTNLAVVELMILSINEMGKGAGCGFLKSCENSHTSPWAFAFGASLKFGLAIRYITS